MMNNWKKNFKESTTNAAFHLHLSTQMVLVLQYVQGGCKDNTLKDLGRFVPSVRCVMDRGLVTWHDRPKNRDHQTWIWYRLTPAGEAVCKLLEYAGVIQSKERQEEVA